MTPRVVVGGLGPGADHHVTDETRQRISSFHDAGLPVRLRTSIHPSAHLAGDPANAPDLATYDEYYETADRFADVYAAIVDDLVALAGAHGSVLYLVPGSPLVLERAVARLRDRDDLDVELLPSLSFLDLCWARLGVDPVETSVRLVDGHTFATQAAGERGPLLVAHCHANWVLSDIKLAVDDGPDEVVLLRALGTDDEEIVRCSWDDLDRTIDADHLTSLWIPELAAPVAVELQRTVELMDTLRTSCPWDAEQTHDSLRRYLIEESYEVVEAIDALDVEAGEGYEDLEEELGDVWFQLLFHARLAAEAGQFTIADVARTVHDKLVSRHPHVFADVAVDGADDVVTNWEAIKREEKQRSSVMEGIPGALPALSYAEKVLRKADRVGTSIPDLEAEPTADADLDEDTLARQLLALVDRARRAGLDPEQALRELARRAADRHAAGERAGGTVPADWLD